MPPKKSTQPATHDSLEPGRIRIDNDRVFLRPDTTGTEDGPFLITEFERKASVVLKRVYGNVAEFDIIGAWPALSNALRRVILSEIPTMAIENVFVINNTSVIPDEVLAHRLGLVPIYVDPRKFDFAVSGGEATDVNTLVFELHAKCTIKEGSKKDDPPHMRYIDSSVLSSKIKWVPQGAQADVLKPEQVRPLNNDILLAKLRGGQEIELELHCVKGLGKDHAKWSPVSSIHYRLMPRITLKEDILGEKAALFAECFPKGVVEIESFQSESGGKSTRAFIKNARMDTVSREVLRNPEFSDKVILSRVHDHFIFHVETVGFYSPTEVVRQGFDVLIEKCIRLKAAIANL